MQEVKTSKFQTFGLFIFGAVTIILWNIPGGGLILYPFTLLGTWFHEMAHGLTALLLGGNFHELVIFSNGSGYAQFSYSTLFLGSFGKSLVAAAGPIGPSIAGALFVMASTNVKASKYILYIFSFLLITSSLIWVRPIFSFGFLIVALFSVFISLISYKANDRLKILTLQFLAVQAFISVYLSIGYLFSSGANVGGTQNMSDTQVIADSLFLPYWFWGGLILIFNMLMIYYSLNFYLKRIKNSSADLRSRRMSLYN